MKNVLTIFALLFLIGCSDNTEKQTVDSPPPTEEVKEEPTTNDEQPTPDEQVKDETTTLDFKQFFKPDNTTATFLGEGNEFASYTEKTKWLSDQFVATVIDNGGAVTMRVYRVFKDRIDKVYDELVEGIPNEVVYPELSQLENAQVIDTFLAGPIEVGTTFGKWKIIEIGTTLETPYKTFENVFVIEETGDGYVNRKYFVEGYGDVKTESIMNTDQDEEFIVTSTLESIK